MNFPAPIRAPCLNSIAVAQELRRSIPRDGGTDKSLVDEGSEFYRWCTRRKYNLQITEPLGHDARNRSTPTLVFPPHPSGSPFSNKRFNPSFASSTGCFDTCGFHLIELIEIGDPPHTTPESRLLLPVIFRIVGDHVPPHPGRIIACLKRVFQQRFDPGIGSDITSEYI